MARICDICGREIGIYNARYSLTYKTALWVREKDICPLCFDRLKEQFNKVETEPQTDIEIARAIVHKAIDDAVIAEDAYPDLRQKMHDAVDNYEPKTESEGE